MLCLSRNRGETIVIGDNIEVMVIDIVGNKVRLGITAPSDVSIHRREVFDAIKREGNRGSQAKTSITKAKNTENRGDANHGQGF